MSLMTLITVGALVLVAELSLAFALSLTRRLGAIGRALSGALCRAPLLDVLVAVMTLVPPIAGLVIGSWPGVAAAIAGQLLSIAVWIVLHETVHRRAARGPRLVKTQNAIAGRWRNLTALWFSILALPILWIVRIGEITLYPPLRGLLGFPRYRHGDWVNVSRHKFEGLVGHDLIWCLYCDWMTGIYSLAGEMLRNVESFWCPIRFHDARKCENCRIDFPDIERWATPDGSVAPAVSLLERQYAGGHRAWFEHPARLTVHGDRVTGTARDAGETDSGT